LEKAENRKKGSKESRAVFDLRNEARVSEDEKMLSRHRWSIMRARYNRIFRR